MIDGEPIKEPTGPEEAPKEQPASDEINHGDAAAGRMQPPESKKSDADNPEDDKALEDALAGTGVSKEQVGQLMDVTLMKEQGHPVSPEMDAQAQATADALSKEHPEVAERLAKQKQKAEEEVAASSEPVTPDESNVIKETQEQQRNLEAALAELSTDPTNEEKRQRVVEEAEHAKRHHDAHHADHLQGERWKKIVGGTFTGLMLTVVIAILILGKSANAVKEMTGGK